jgi:hypothetical protein
MSSGGSCYDANRRSEQHKHPDHGIWLYWNCSERIEDSPVHYMVETLQEGKQRTEQNALMHALAMWFDVRM